MTRSLLPTAWYEDVYDMKDRNTNNIALLCVLLCGAFGTFAAEPLRGPEAWLELMGGNARKDGLRLDLEAIREAGFSGVQFFHIGDRAGKDQKGSMVWPGCERTLDAVVPVGMGRAGEGRFGTPCVMD